MCTMAADTTQWLRWRRHCMQHRINSAKPHNPTSHGLHGCQHTASLPRVAATAHTTLQQVLNACNDYTRAALCMLPACTAACNVPQRTQQPLANNIYAWIHTTTAQ
jgi:hypothetical protein